MSAAAFGRALVDDGFEARAHATGNSWGFGGSTGTAYWRGNVRVLVAQAHCRCAAANTKFVTVTVGGRRIVDAVQGKRAFEAAGKAARDAGGAS